MLNGCEFSLDLVTGNGQQRSSPELLTRKARVVLPQRVIVVGKGENKRSHDQEIEHRLERILGRCVRFTGKGDKALAMEATDEFHMADNRGWCLVEECRLPDGRAQIGRRGQAVIAEVCSDR